MRVAVTGTPGTGKTTVTEELSSDIRVVHLNECIEDNDALVQDIDTERLSKIVDLPAVDDVFANKDTILIESHLAHHFDVDVIIVLRCHPTELERRLQKRGMGTNKISENMEAEALDVILIETLEKHDSEKIFEIDTSEQSITAVAEQIDSVIAGHREPQFGLVDYSSYFLNNNHDSR